MHLEQEPLLDVSMNRRTLALMKGHFATTFGLTSALALVAFTVSAHPGHSPTDVAAQLAAPIAGVDHFATFAVFAALTVLAATRIAVHFIQRRNSRRMRPVRR